VTTSKRFTTRQPVEAAFALPVAFLGQLLIGVVAVAADGRVGSGLILGLTSVLVAVTAFVAQPLAAAPLAVIGWFTVAAFSRPPYGDLHAGGTGIAVAVLAAMAAAGALAGVVVRRVQAISGRMNTAPAGAGTDAVAVSEVAVVTVDQAAPAEEAAPPAPARRPAAAPVLVRRSRPRLSAIGRRRLLASLGLAALLLPLLTVILVAARPGVPLVNDVLLYLLAVIVVTMIGGFWPAVVAAIAAGLLLNWYFTPPVHNWTIDAPQNIVALLLFVTAAVIVSSVVHLAAQRHALAGYRANEASTLLALARTVLSDDRPEAVLDHLQASMGLAAMLVERSGGRWIRVAGDALTGGTAHEVPAGDDLRLLVYGDITDLPAQLLDGYAVQAAAAFARQRLRIQASQAEALAEGNRMRTALLAAVSHDLRTPLASVKAAVGTLRQTDITWTAEDQAALLATIEEGADRLDGLIGNLLDMSRVQTGALQPFVRPTALDEVAPLAIRGLDGGDGVRLAIPDELPLLATDPGLLERALANLVANALRYSPQHQPPTVSAWAAGQAVVIDVIDHGPGIAPAERGRVFEPFQQLGDHRTAGGVGLGLAVAKGFVEAVGGSIAARSTHGGGLTMRIALPVAAADRSVGAQVRTVR
jgi:two-component system, OmpR family, sensor histidine kinase KdpD